MVLRAVAFEGFLQNIVCRTNVASVLLCPSKVIFYFLLWCDLCK